MSWKVAALYRFMTLEDPAAWRETLTTLCRTHGVCGTLLVAPEGVNGTIAAAPDALDHVIAEMDALLGICQGELKFSSARDKPFDRLKVRLKKEIITMKAPEADPARHVGTYVDPADWNKLLADPDMTVLDTRNLYETETGMFRGAMDPGIRTFTEFKDFVKTRLDPARHRKVAMYCTGGIRCEKASSYMLAHGFEAVYHLKGGILKYLEDVPREQSLWEGTCFVFDKRIELGQGLCERNGVADASSDANAPA